MRKIKLSIYDENEKEISLSDLSYGEIKLLNLETSWLSEKIFKTRTEMENNYLQKSELEEGYFYDGCGRSCSGKALWMRGTFFSLRLKFDIWSITTEDYYGDNLATSTYKPVVKQERCPLEIIEAFNNKDIEKIKEYYEV